MQVESIDSIYRIFLPHSAPEILSSDGLYAWLLNDKGEFQPPTSGMRVYHVSCTYTHIYSTRLMKVGCIGKGSGRQVKHPDRGSPRPHSIADSFQDSLEPRLLFHYLSSFSSIDRLVCAISTKKACSCGSRDDNSGRRFLSSSRSSL
jgi:hypothetical protein